ncbi:hypothetical protein RND71_044194 [Anisodus tanguticus]|uniref:CCR4-NOT transcription complex subunit 1 n=1 Tax=Anisodus tanguticus TaxID=243964 RepID=A0AAE1QP33_9SOLA|nr:hypothetical protein RND71_044194 [Anisodus tanguticus]
MSISQELSETILTMVANSPFILQKATRQAPPGVLGSSNQRTQSSINSASNSLNTLSSLSDLNSVSIGGSVNSSLLNNSRNNFNLNNMVPQNNSPFSMVFGNLPQQSNTDKIRNTENFLDQKVAPEIEKEADTYFQRIYNQSSNGSMTVDEVLDMLKRFQDSPNKRERQVAYCMLKNLFKEYRYFPQYPDKELMITAQLFGGIIQTGIAKFIPLVVALRHVLEALKSQLGSKMYFFGITALDRFKTKLKEYPLYCQHLMNLSNFCEFPPALIEYVNYGKQSQDPPFRSNISNVLHQESNSPIQQISLAKNLNQSLQGVLPNNTSVNSMQMMLQNTILSNQPKSVGQSTTNPPSSVSSSSVLIGNTTQRPSIANATNIDTLLAAGDNAVYKAPSETIQDKVAFIINNLSQMNLLQKTDEFKEIINKEETLYHDWIAQYFVMKRASIEPNFHSLYANFIDVLKIDELTKTVIKETYRNIKVLLRSNKEIANFSDRSLLKNLGHWLGLLTLAKNKPILAIDLNLKFLLIEAYHKGIQELLYVVPFIAKVLESCAKSKVFKPPNPWTMGIVKVLIELHQEPDLKLNLKFEVEVLSKTLNVDINEWIGKTHVLKNEEIMNRVMSQQQLSGCTSKHPQQQSVVVNNNNMPAQVQHLATQINQINLSQQQVQQTRIGPSITTQPQQPVSQNSQVSLLPPSSEHSGFLPNSTSPTISSFANNQSVIPQLSTSSSQVLIGPSTSSTRTFNYNDININNTNCLAQLISIPNNLPLLQFLPNLKQWVRNAIERAIQDWMQPIIDRSIKSTIGTAESLIKKDFALESDENKMCLAAQFLIRNLTAGMAMITCKEALFVSIKNAIANAFNNSPNVANKDLAQSLNNNFKFMKN